MTTDPAPSTPKPSTLETPRDIDTTEGMSLIESSLLNLVRDQGCTITRLEREILKKDALIAELRASSGAKQAEGGLQPLGEATLRPLVLDEMDFVENR